MSEKKVEIHRDRAAPVEFDKFRTALIESLLPFGFKKVDEYWLTETSGDGFSAETSYSFLCRNQTLQIDARVFTSERYFVSINVRKLAASSKYDDEFDLIMFTGVTATPYFHNKSKLRGQDYLDAFTEYLGELFKNEVWTEVLSGRFWFPFYVDFRDWYTTPALQEKMKAEFATAWKNRGRKIRLV